MYRQLTILSLCLALAAGLTGAWLAPRVQVVLCHWTGSLSTALVDAEPSLCRYAASLHWSHRLTLESPT